MPDSVKHKIPVTLQSDNYSCGFCAANSVYKYYGLDPVQRDLRGYLGTDHSLPYNVPFRDRIEALLGGPEYLPSGTWPMDLLAVMYWDGFDCQIVSGKVSAYKSILLPHLLNGDCAIAMMYDCMHWVVISGMDKTGVWVVDGYFTANAITESRSRSHTFRLPHDQFQSELQGMILVSREDCAADEIREITTADYIREYARGVGFCCKVAGRQIPRYVSRLLPRNWEAG